MPNTSTSIQQSIWRHWRHDHGHVTPAPRRTQVTHKYGSIYMHSCKPFTSSIFVSTWQIPTVPTTTTTRSQATCAIRHQLGRHHTKPTCWSVTPSSPLGRCHAVPTFLERPTSNWNSRPNSPGNTSRQHTDSRVVPRQVPGFRHQILRTTQYRNIANSGYPTPQHQEQTTRDDILIGTNLLGQLRSHVGERRRFSGVNPEKKTKSGEPLEQQLAHSNR